MLGAITPDVITRAKNGDTKVITALYERYRLSIFRYLYYRVGDAQAAEDLTSEVFLRMIRALDGYQSQGAPFDAWLFQIARNLVIDHHRKRQRQPQLPLQENLIAEDQDVAATVEDNLTSARLVSALEQLNETYRDVIVLRFVSGLPIAQVARTLHKSEDSIKGLQRRALSSLREILSDAEVHDESNG